MDLCLFVLFYFIFCLVANIMCGFFWGSTHICSTSGSRQEWIMDVLKGETSECMFFANKQLFYKLVKRNELFCEIFVFVITYFENIVEVHLVNGTLGMLSLLLLLCSVLF